MAAVMNEEQFSQFMGQFYSANTAEKQVAVLAIVDQHEGIVHRANWDGVRLLHKASISGRLNLMRGVIDRGAVVNAKNSDGADALMLAAFNGQIPAATLLLDHGADLNARDNSGWNALMWAAYKDMIDCAVFLLNRGVDLLAVDLDDQTALDLYGANSNINPPLSKKTKNKRIKVLRATFAKGPHPSQVKRRNDECWSRRRAIMLVVTQNNFRPLAARRLEQKLARASLDPAVEAEVPPPVVLDTPEKRRAYYMGQVLSNDGLLRLVVSFL